MLAYLYIRIYTKPTVNTFVEEMTPIANEMYTLFTQGYRFYTSVTYKTFPIQRLTTVIERVAAGKPTIEEVRFSSTTLQPYVQIEPHFPIPAVNYTPD